MTSERTRLITVSASYGAGGSVVAPALADRLGVPFLNRATSRSGAIEGDQPCFERLVPGESDLTPVSRLLASFTQAMPAGPTQSPPSAHHLDHRLRGQCEDGIHRLADADAGVILGRAGAVVLGKEHGFHVRLDGPPDLRLVQGAEVEGVSLDEARQHMNAADRARTAYVRRLYRADPADSRYYHLVIDSTAMPIDAVTDLILRALSSFRAPLTTAKDSAPAGR